MIEPYQPGKIPVILVHGLLSDSFTWTALGNELRVHPELRQRYQFWTYSYASGEPFLTSAAVLREELARVRATYDPERCDPALGRIVLVGHSMGGLIAKLQATHSGDALWASSATRPLESLNAPPYVHRQLRRGFYFTPSPDVARIVFIGTPHRGSAWASRTVGQVGAALVAEPPERKASFEQLVRDNPDVFRGDLQQRIPTSVDLLEPTSALLQAMNELPYRSGVPLHTILGSGRWTLGEGPSDGVVAVDSARLEGVQSELVVDASHEELPRQEAVMAEVVRILRRHAR
jgi:pimeloyl-ACP methyl ester carboxylesterase